MPTNTLALAFTIDNGYTKQLSVVFASLCAHQHASTQYHIYVAGYGLSDASKEFLQVTLHQLNAQNVIHFIDISQSDYQRIPKLNQVITSLRSGWSGQAILRLFLPQYLPKLDRILYLDSDIVVMSDLAHLAQVNLFDKAIAASADAAIAYQLAKVQWRLYRLACVDDQHNNHRLLTNLRRYDYINSGVMIMNLAFWRDQQLGEQALGLLKKLYLNANLLQEQLASPASGYDGSKEAIFPDQDITNYLLMKDGLPLIQYLPAVYNATLNLFSIDDQVKALTLTTLQPAQYLMRLKLDDAVSDTTLEREALQIVHFAGTGSPWKLQGVDHPFAVVYRKLAQQVGWSLPYAKLLWKKRIRNLIKGLMPHALMQYIARTKGH